VSDALGPSTPPDPIAWLQLQFEPRQAEAGKVWKLTVWQQLQGGLIDHALKINTFHVVAVSGHIMQHTVRMLLLMQHTPNAADYQHSCLVQSAVNPGSAEQAARVISTAAQHRLKNGVRQVQQGD
jgi:hypothetical protein